MATAVAVGVTLLTCDDAQAVSRFKAPGYGCGNQSSFEAENLAQHYQLGDAEGTVAPAMEREVATAATLGAGNEELVEPGPALSSLGTRTMRRICLSRMARAVELAELLWSDVRRQIAADRGPAKRREVVLAQSAAVRPALSEAALEVFPAASPTAQAVAPSTQPMPVGPTRLYLRGT